MSSLFRDSSASDPRIAIDNAGDAHFVWERVTVVDTTYWWPSGNFIFYKSAIYYRVRNAAGVLSQPQLIDSGYFPQICTDDNNTVHILYFTGSSSTAESFEMKYIKGIGGNFQTPRTLTTGIQAGLDEDNGAKLSFSFSVNSDGSRIHVGWTGRYSNYGVQRGVYYLLAIGDSIRIDSTRAVIGYGDNARFVFQKTDNTIFAVWHDNASLYQSSSARNSLFSETNIRSGNLSGPSELFFNPMDKNAPSYLYTYGTSDTLNVRNLETGSDTVLVITPTPNSISGKVVVGPQGDLYALYGPKIMHIYRNTTGINGSKVLQTRNFHLSQNYPNPFNPSTKIEYNLPQQSQVRLTIFNIFGQEVTNLFNGIQEPGSKTITWNAGGIASGVYFYRLDAISVAEPGKTFRDVKKMVVIK
jgi:hypothetical protein